MEAVRTGIEGVAGRTIASVGLLCLLVGFSGAARAADERIRLHGAGGLAFPLAGHQARELGPGGFAQASVEWATSSRFGFEFGVGFDVLSASGATPPPRVAPLDWATATTVSLGVRFRPLGPPRSGASLGGLWVSPTVGASLTGGEVVPALSALLGYEWFVSERWAFGPLAGYSVLFDTTTGPRSDHAHLLHAGVGVSFEFLGQVAPRAPSDADRDGVFDARDRCPREPEDRDGFEDDDGCPELDNDGDGVLDSGDVCPLVPEDPDGFEDLDGCPEDDNDGDGIPDDADRCPGEPEDKDDFQDTDGCPEDDNDGDHIPDAKDLCPNEPETYNGFSDNDGCPDEQHVRVVGDKIELDQKIHFWSDSAKIRGMSYPVLNKLAEFLAKHPEYVHISIEGHADERGPAELNRKLSASRAESVKKFLVEKGIDEARISFVGHGSSRPLVEGSGEYAWFMNRRVELVVTRNREVVVSQPPAELPPSSLSEEPRAEEEQP